MHLSCLTDIYLVSSIELRYKVINAVLCFMPYPQKHEIGEITCGCEVIADRSGERARQNSEASKTTRCSDMLRNGVPYSHYRIFRRGPSEHQSDWGSWFEKVVIARIHLLATL